MGDNFLGFAHTGRDKAATLPKGRRAGRLAAAATVAVVLAGAVFWIGQRIYDSKRWSGYPHTMGCSVEPDAEWAATGLSILPPPAVRVQQVTLTHLGGERMELSLEFLRSVPPQPVSIVSPLSAKPMDAPGSFTYLIVLGGADSDSGTVTIASPQDGADWQAGQMYGLLADVLGEPTPKAYDPTRNLVTSSRLSGPKTMNLVLDLKGVTGLFGHGPFRPSVTVTATKEGRPTRDFPEGEPTLFDSQQCRWDRQAISTESQPDARASESPESVAASSAERPIPRSAPVPPSTAARSIAGMVVMLDPALAGGNADGRQVPNGRGGFAECQPRAASTDAGYAEHTFAWDTTLRVRAALTSLGVRTAMSRGNDDKVGPCVNERATMTNSLAVHPDAVVSLHAYATASSVRGFTIHYPYPPLSGRKGSPATQLAQILYDQMTASGVPAASNGPHGRADSAFLNLVEHPVVEVELGNMSNPSDAEIMMSPGGRQKYADAVTAGIVAFLQAQPQ